MNDHIPGSPLKTLTWNRENQTVNLVFRPETPYYDRLDFFLALEDEIAEHKLKIFSDIWS